MKKLFNKKVFLLLITLSIGIYWVIQYFRPIIVIENNSAQKAYIYSMQSNSNPLATPEQMYEYIKISRVINPKNTFLFYPRLNLLKNNNNKVLVKLRLSTSKKTHFFKNFTLRSDKGYCRPKIVINDDASYVVHDDNVWLCLKKIHVITDEEMKDMGSVLDLRRLIKKQVSPEHYEKIMQKVDESREFVTTEIFLNIVREVTTMHDI